MARDLGSVLEAILAGVVVLDREGRVQELNSAASRLVEHSRESVLGRPVEALVEPGHAVARVGRQALATGVPISESGQRIERRTEGDAEVDVAASPLFDRRGRVDGVVLVLRDRAAYRRLEQLEAERERFASFGRIAAGLAHEIKNPLGGIQGAGELLLSRAADPKTRETAALIVRESARIAGLVDDFMVFARGERLRLGPVNLHRILDGVLDLLAHDPIAQGCSFERLYDPSIPEFLADADRLVQVFLNLSRNGLQAMEHRGGVLSVSTGLRLDHRIAVGDERPVPAIAIWLRDTGRGMSADELRQARMPFFTTRAGGTGLGLAVAEYWIAQHQGTLHIESEKERGTAVRVTLPLRRIP
jgi:two-component system nitrogen regulation sensor histidine kinase GlnL